MGNTSQNPTPNTDQQQGFIHMLMQYTLPIMLGIVGLLAATLFCPRNRHRH